MVMVGAFEALVVLIVFGSLLLGLLIIAWMVVRLLRGGRNAHSSNAEESQLMQELYHGLTRLEQRVESLETLLLDREQRTGGGK